MKAFILCKKLVEFLKTDCNAVVTVHCVPQKGIHQSHGGSSDKS